MSVQTRRKLLKSITACGSVLIIGKSLPESWVKPVVNVALLPAHAQTSMCASLVISSPSSVTVQALLDSASDIDGIQVSFDGCDDLTMFATDEPDTNADLIAFFDVDAAEPSEFDVDDGPAGNWSLISHSFASLPVKDETEGLHRITVERLAGVSAGTTYDILFNVSVSAITDGAEMTISGLRAEIV